MEPKLGVLHAAFGTGPVDLVIGNDFDGALSDYPKYEVLARASVLKSIRVTAAIAATAPAARQNHGNEPDEWYFAASVQSNTLHRVCYS